MTAFDGPRMCLCLVIVLVTLLLGLLIATLVRRLLPSLARTAGPFAGAAANATAPDHIWQQVQTIFISGARPTAGFVVHDIAGGSGGWILANIARERADITG